MSLLYPTSRDCNHPKYSQPCNRASLEHTALHMTRCVW
nr:MAG TPA: hypothetical protein [Caudoviricetes sp.]